MPALSSCCSLLGTRSPPCTLGGCIQKRLAHGPRPTVGEGSLLSPAARAAPFLALGTASVSEGLPCCSPFASISGRGLPVWLRRRRPSLPGLVPFPAIVSSRVPLGGDSCVALRGGLSAVWSVCPTKPELHLYVEEGCRAWLGAR